MMTRRKCSFPNYPDYFDVVLDGSAVLACTGSSDVACDGSRRYLITDQGAIKLIADCGYIALARFGFDANFLAATISHWRSAA